MCYDLSRLRAELRFHKYVLFGFSVFHRLRMPLLLPTIKLPYDRNVKAVGYDCCCPLPDIN